MLFFHRRWEAIFLRASGFGSSSPRICCFFSHFFCPQPTNQQTNSYHIRFTNSSSLTCAGQLLLWLVFFPLVTPRPKRWNLWWLLHNLLTQQSWKCLAMCSTLPCNRSLLFFARRFPLRQNWRIFSSIWLYIHTCFFYLTLLYTPTCPLSLMHDDHHRQSCTLLQLHNCQVDDDTTTSLNCYIYFTPFEI